MQRENFRLSVGSECDRREKRLAPTNERYTSFYHEMYTAGDEDQFFSALKNLSLVKSVVAQDSNLFFVRNVLRPWDKYKNLSSRSVKNTFEYLFYRFKKGIFVQIHNNKLDTFQPFSNVNFRNDWWPLIKVDPKYGSVIEFLDYSSQLGGYRPNKVLPLNRWTSNNALVRYEETSREFTNNLAVLFDMFDTLCKERNVPDVEFFLNRKDFPLLTRDGTEPYNHLYGSKNQPLKQSFESYCPIFSAASSDRFADVLVPTYEDWLRVLYQEKSQFVRFSCKFFPLIVKTPWERKIRKAVFRGSSTGAGFDSETNKRLKALDIGQKHSLLLDVGITKWNTRPRKYESEQFLRTIDRRDYPVANKLSPQEQSRFAYVIHIEGHSAAFRLSYELSFGSVLLIVESEWKLWFSKFLIPWKHFVPVKADLSDLVEKVRWCKENDESCEAIAANALEFYNEYLSYRGVLDYLQKTLIDVSEMTGKYGYVTDILSVQLQNEKDCVEETLKTFKWVKVHNPPRFQLPFVGWRNPNYLAASLLSFHGSSSRPLLIKKLFSSKKTVVNIVQVGILRLVEKTSFIEQSKKENLHENFLGLKVLNRLNLVNFAYVYGPLFEDRPDVVYSEFIEGVKMSDWLVSNAFNEKLFLLMLVQLNLALMVAQNRFGFVHYDLYPWNVVLVKLDEERDFIYNVKSNLVLKVKTDLVPVMIDFGKSRAVVYDKSSKSIRDHGMVDLYNSNKILDTLTILVSSLHLVNRGDLSKKFSLFFSATGMPADTYQNLDFVKKYGQLFKHSFQTDVDPLSFVNFVIKQIGKLSNLKKGTFSLETSPGNPYTLFFHSVYGDKKRSLMETMQRILSNSVPNPLTDVERRYTRITLDRMTEWLRQTVYRMQNADLTRKWEYVYSLLINGRRNGSLKVGIDFSLPDPPTKLKLDKSLTPDEINEFANNLTYIYGDLPTTLAMYTELVFLDIEQNSVSAALDRIPNRFDYLSNIAKNNSILWLQALIV